MNISQLPWILLSLTLSLFLPADLIAVEGYCGQIRNELSSRTLIGPDTSNEWLLRLEEGMQPERFLENYKERFPNHPEVIRVVRTAIPAWNLHLLNIDLNGTAEEALLGRVLLLEGVRHFYRNRKVSFRSGPNDEYYPEQASLELIGAPEVWKATTGGVNKLGDTLVVAILDSGFDTDHRDFKGNRWVNPAEVAGDGLDNDSNGLVDDIHGWNFAGNTDTFSRSTHGTSVAGVVGARGNNELFISGVNWAVKMMFLQIDSVIDVVEAYYYALSQRRTYNRTGGAEGAFVVVTNASFGITTPTPCENFPDWMEVYDSLGMDGILSVAATLDQGVDVDERGDTPSGCPSDYLISVTNTTPSDRFFSNSGYGLQSIDLGAPGEETLSLDVNDGLNRNFGGTSASCPHVAGAIALLYSLPCQKLADEYAKNSAGTALFMKSVILGGVDTLPDLIGRTLSGGRLNISKSLGLLEDFCDVPSGPLNFLQIKPNPAGSFILVRYLTPDFGSYNLRIFNSLGQLMAQQELEPKRFEDNELRISLNTFGTGLYFLEISGGGKSAVTRFIKSR